jgi:hypothetical protein
VKLQVSAMNNVMKNRVKEIPVFLYGEICVITKSHPIHAMIAEIPIMPMYLL